MPLAPGIIVHFTQLPILISGILVEPVGGLVTGATGGLYMSLVVARIPFVGGLAILGCASGLFSKRLRPFFLRRLGMARAGTLRCSHKLHLVHNILTENAAGRLDSCVPMMTKLTIETIISSALAEVITRYLKRTRILQHFSSA